MSFSCGFFSIWMKIFHKMKEQILSHWWPSKGWMIYLDNGAVIFICYVFVVAKIHVSLKFQLFGAKPCFTSNWFLIYYIKIFILCSASENYIIWRYCLYASILCFYLFPSSPSSFSGKQCLTIFTISHTQGSLNPGRQWLVLNGTNCCYSAYYHQTEQILILHFPYFLHFEDFHALSPLRNF